VRLPFFMRGRPQEYCKTVAAACLLPKGNPRWCAQPQACHSAVQWLRVWVRAGKSAPDSPAAAFGCHACNAVCRRTAQAYCEGTAAVLLSVR
jgi:MinD superfamily P-loop ATPase